MEIDNLRKYVESSSPEVNRRLRNNEDASDLPTFDGLFNLTEIPSPLYRLLPNEYVKMSNGVFVDKGYLSCTTDIDKFITHVDGSDIACLDFDITGEVNCIKVNDLLPEYMDEREYILPREISFNLNQIDTYSDKDGIGYFLDIVGSVMTADELLNIYRISSITCYKFSVAN